eukprot:CAMPEP_0167795636 /NCGR_PEP_ID=MMETSP0111_2-20121227/14558_1 /TAXON_ID=91324 /ORGANISM="Lotharella globosa, Strain CCCM811" /LENGTH=356 /DNA_ID=CAMNT_0007689351 /DNA_START=459 /DNA_END=1529 /DNA_ORIENTATION=+
MPTWLTSTCLTIVLAMTTYRMLSKGFKVFKRENAIMEPRASSVGRNSYGSFTKTESHEALGSWVEEKTSSEATRPGLSRRASTLSVTDVADFATDKQMDTMLSEPDSLQNPLSQRDSNTDDPQLEALLAREARVFQTEKVAAVVLIFLIVVVLTIAKGGQAWSPFDIHCGSLGYWALTFSIIPVVGGAAAIIRQQLMAQYYLKESIAYPYVKGDVHWGPRETLLYPSICAIAGLFAGLFGIGGGIVKGPLMLEMGVLPEVAVATSSTMIFFTTGAATSSFLVFGTLPLRNGLIFFCIGLVGGLFGQLIMTRITRSLSRPSILIFAIAGIIGASTVFMTISSLEAIQAGKGTHGVCA